MDRTFARGRVVAAGPARAAIDCAGDPVVAFSVGQAFATGVVVYACALKAAIDRTSDAVITIKRRSPASPRRANVIRCASVTVIA